MFAATVDGRRSTDDGRRSTDDGRRSTDDGRRATRIGIRRIRVFRTCVTGGFSPHHRTSSSRGFPPGRSRGGTRKEGGDKRKEKERESVAYPIYRERDFIGSCRGQCPARPSSRSRARQERNNLEWSADRPRRVDVLDVLAVLAVPTSTGVAFGGRLFFFFRSEKLQRLR